MTLGYVARGLVQMLGAHFIVSTLLSLAVALAWRGVAAAPTRASVTARRLFALRLLPSAGGLLTGLLVALGYALWESRAEHERVGVVALIAAAGGVVVAASASIRLLMTISCTSRIRRELVAAGRGTMPTRPLPASIIETAFPVVAIVGLVRLEAVRGEERRRGLLVGGARGGAGARTGARATARQPSPAGDGRGP